MVKKLGNTFDLFEKEMKEHDLKISRVKWNDVDHYIFWNHQTTEYSEHVNGENRVWFWSGANWFKKATEDILATDWYEVGEAIRRIAV